jgi:flagellar hook-associated protein 3 FlgL
MRVSSQQIFSAGIEAMSQHAADVTRYQEQISSGNRYSRASENPLAAGLAVQVSLDKQQFAMFKANQDYATATLNTTDSLLSNINNMLLRVQQLMVQAGNDALGTEGRVAIGFEVEQLTKSIERAAALDGPNSLPLLRHGAGNLTEVLVAPELTVKPGILYEDVMGLDKPGGNKTDIDKVDVLAALQAFSERLAQGSAPRPEDFTNIQASVQQVTRAQVLTGVRTNQLEMAISMAEQFDLNVEFERATLLDTDLIQATAGLAKSSALLQAAQAVVSRININALFGKI